MSAAPSFTIVIVNVSGWPLTGVTPGARPFWTITRPPTVVPPSESLPPAPDCPPTPSSVPVRAALTVTLLDAAITRNTVTTLIDWPGGSGPDRVAVGRFVQVMEPGLDAVGGGVALWKRRY